MTKFLAKFDGFKSIVSLIGTLVVVILYFALHKINLPTASVLLGLFGTTSVLSLAHHIEKFIDEIRVANPSFDIDDVIEIIEELFEGEKVKNLIKQEVKEAIKVPGDDKVKK